MEINKLSIHDEENQTHGVDLGGGACTSAERHFADAAQPCVGSLTAVPHCFIRWPFKDNTVVQNKEKKRLTHSGACK